VADGRLAALYLPCRALPDIGCKLPELLDGRHHVGSDEELARLIEAGCKSASIAFSHAVPDDDPTIAAVDEVIRRFAVGYSECRAVALFDIASFSLKTTYDQMAQLRFLSYCINLVAAHCRKQGFPIDLRSSTTGDGFYVWNRNEGFVADQALYFVAGLTLVANNSVRGGDKTDRGVPALRCCIGLGSHFEYCQSSGDGAGAAGASEYIVGDVTIGLSRLISMTLPGQVLIASHMRVLGEIDASLRHALGTDAIDSSTFVALSQGIVDRATGLALPSGAEIAEISSYLTGEQISDNEFTIRKYLVADKHGIEHRCFNLKFNAVDSSGRNVFVGLRNDDLADFQARHLEHEDIRVRLA
jgi:class 3 adenylate cyclase